jgi:hypothetical protein
VTMQKGTCILRAVAISGYTNLIKKGTLKV